MDVGSTVVMKCEPKAVWLLERSVRPANTAPRGYPPCSLILLVVELMLFQQHQSFWNLSNTAGKESKTKNKPKN